MGCTAGIVPESSRVLQNLGHCVMAVNALLLVWLRAGG